MTMHRNDLNEVYQAVEQTIGPNVGVNSVLFNIKGVIATGTGRNLRVYYVPVVFPNAAAGSQFNAIVVTIVPKQAPYRHTAAYMGSAVASYDVILANIANAIKAAGDTTIPVSAVAYMIA